MFPSLLARLVSHDFFFLQKQEELSAPFGPFQPPWSRSACRPRGLVKKNDLVNAFTRERWGDRGWKPALLNETTPLYAGPLESCGAARPGARHVFTSATMEYIGLWVWRSRWLLCPEWHNLGIIVGRRARIARFWTILGSSASWRGRGTRGQVQVLPLRGPPVDSESAIKTLANVPSTLVGLGHTAVHACEKSHSSRCVKTAMSRLLCRGVSTC